MTVQTITRLFFMLCSIMLAAAAHAETAGIQVNGSAKVSIVPDIARFSFAVDGRGNSLPALKREIDEKTAAVIALSKNLGIENRSISSAEVSIHPQYNHQTRELLGYTVSRNINVELHDLSRYSDLVNGAIESGITTINNISMDVADRDVLAAQALASAVKAARQKAEIIASNTGIKLGKILSVQEAGSNFDNRRYGVKTMAMSESTITDVFEPGEISVTATVTVVYSIR